MFKLKGVIPPMITPFKSDGQVDSDGIEILVRFLKDKVDGLFICGSYGSGPLMSVEERKKVAEVVRKSAKDSVPIIVHAGTTNTRDTVELIKHAEKIGCDGCAAVAPYYFHHNEDSILEFYSQMIKSVNKKFPVYLYYNPKFSGYSLSLTILRHSSIKNVSGP